MKNEIRLNKRLKKKERRLGERNKINERMNENKEQSKIKDKSSIWEKKICIWRTEKAVYERQKQYMSGKAVKMLKK